MRLYSASSYYAWRQRMNSSLQATKRTLPELCRDRESGCTILDPVKGKWTRKLRALRVVALP